MNMCSAFTRNGHETALYARGSGGAHAAREIFPRYGVSDRFDLRLRPAMRVKLLGRLGYALRQAAHARLADRADLYYARCLPSAAFVLMLGGTAILEAHELPHSALERRIQRFVLRHRNLRRLVVISQALLDDLAREHPGVLDSVDCLVAPDGANAFTPSEPFPLARGPGRQIGYAGGLRPGNGLGMLLALAEAFPRDTFHVLGGPAEEAARWQLAQKSANVVWYGQSPPARVPSFLTACDVLLAPYEPGAKTSSGNDTSRWMSPLKIFEYMAAGKAMIVSDFPVLREVLTDDIAVLAEAANVEAWKAALERLRDAAVRTRLGNAARDELERRYTWAARARSVLEDLDEASVRRPRRAQPEVARVRSATKPA